MKGEKEVTSLIREAAKLHGHLGPFLIIGLRMGTFAKENLKSEAVGKGELRASIRIHLTPPFSCVLDGIQVATNCTIGNQRLRVEESKKMVACFELGGSDRIVHISVNPETVKELVAEMSKGVTNEELAARIMSMPDENLFQFEKQ